MFKSNLKLLVKLDSQNDFILRCYIWHTPLYWWYYTPFGGPVYIIIFNIVHFQLKLWLKNVLNTSYCSLYFIFLSNTLKSRNTCYLDWLRYGNLMMVQLYKNCIIKFFFWKFLVYINECHNCRMRYEFKNVGLMNRLFHKPTNL